MKFLLIITLSLFSFFTLPNKPSVAVQEGCVAVGPFVQDFPATGYGEVKFTFNKGCGFEIVSRPDWVGGPLYGTYYVKDNNGPARTGQIITKVTNTDAQGNTIDTNYTYTINQAAGVPATPTPSPTPTPTPAPCTYSLSPSAANISTNGGTGTITVATQTGCNYTASTNASFITLAFVQGGISYTVAFNSTAARTGTINISGQIFTVNQQGAPQPTPTVTPTPAVTPTPQNCTYFINPTSQDFPISGGTTNITVTTAQGCAVSASTDASYITLTPNQAGLSITVAANSGVARTATITIANQTFTVNQAGGKSRKRVRFF